MDSGRRCDVKEAPPTEVTPGRRLPVGPTLVVVRQGSSSRETSITDGSYIHHTGRVKLHSSIAIAGWILSSFEWESATRNPAAHVLP